MHVQVVTFRLEGLDPAAYAALCDELAPRFAEVPGLVAKLWLSDPHANLYGGVYMWENRDALEAFTKTELFRAVATHPKLSGLVSREFGVLEDPSRITRGLASLAA